MSTYRPENIGKPFGTSQKGFSLISWPLEIPNREKMRQEREDHALTLPHYQWLAVVTHTPLPVLPHQSGNTRSAIACSSPCAHHDLIMNHHDNTQRNDEQKGATLLHRPIQEFLFCLQYWHHFFWTEIIKLLLIISVLSIVSIKDQPSPWYHHDIMKSTDNSPTWDRSTWKSLDAIAAIPKHI